MSHNDTTATEQDKDCGCSHDNNCLTEKEAIEKLSYLEGWIILEDKGIARLDKTFKIKNFRQGVELLNKLEHLTQEFNHHPEIQLRYRDISISWHTYSVKGLTDLDFASAEACDALYNDLTKEN